jgi:hypothetical protein
MKNYCRHCHQADDHTNLELPDGSAPRQTMRCPSCHRLVILISILRATAIVQRSRQTIYDWMRTGRISFVKDAGNRRLILYSSLFFPLQNEPGDEDESWIER